LTSLNAIFDVINIDETLNVHFTDVLKTLESMILMQLKTNTHSL